ncbi:MAG: hypothetical protein J3K34DRAFT_447040 [Monoraphidium minutum]|nr:MAG: hypothetical protein J3K34DRAFT_447040 [Monoraphidium minutum]
MAPRCSQGRGARRGSRCGATRGAASQLLALLLAAAMCGPRGASAACEPGYTQFVYMDNKDYLEAKCGSNDVVAQFLHCTGQMEATVLGSSQLQGQCWLRFTPRLAVGRLRPLVGFPCSVFTYEGAGASAETAGPLDLRVNTSGLCEWKATVNASSPAANEFSPMCNPRLTPQQQQAAVLGRCLSPPRFKAEASPFAPSRAPQCTRSAEAEEAGGSAPC